MARFRLVLRRTAGGREFQPDAVQQRCFLPEEQSAPMLPRRDCGTRSSRRLDEQAVQASRGLLKGDALQHVLAARSGMRRRRHRHRRPIEPQFCPHAEHTRMVRMIRGPRPTMRIAGKTAAIAGLAVAMGSCIEATGPSARLSEPRIAFVSNRDGNEEIYTMNSDGTNVVRITNNAARDTRPVWSPDGNSIVFVSERSGNRDVWIMNPDGSGLRNLTQNPAIDESPTWSPDGSRVVFSSTRFGPAKIFITNASAGDTTIVLTDGFATDSWPAYSPDGRFIAFQANRNSLTNDIYVLRNQFNDIFRLTFAVGADDFPAWSPDGTKIAFTSFRDGNFEIYLMV